MQQQELGPDRRALMDLMMNEVMKLKAERDMNAIFVCDRLSSKQKYKDVLQRFNQMDADYKAMFKRWDQLGKGVK